MGVYLVKRFFGAVLVTFAVMTLSFFLIRIAPGGPFDTERTLPPDIMRNIEKKYHLDEPLIKQYWRYTSGILFHFDFGPSYKYPDRTVNEFIAAGFPVTLRLACYSMIVAILLGITAGVVASLKQNQWHDYTVMGIAMFGVTVPNFVLGPIMQLVFGLKLGWFPVAGWDEWGHYVMPSLALGIYYAATIARLTRGGMLEVIRQDYIRTARAKGLPQRLVIWRHMIKGGLLPVMSYLGPAAAFMLSGSLVIEKIFDIPGLGRHFVNSALNRDYTMEMGLVVFFCVLIIVFNLLVDLTYPLLDPRVKNE